MHGICLAILEYGDRDVRPDDLHHENIMVSFSEMRVVLTDPIGLSSGGRRRMEATVRELGLAA